MLINTLKIMILQLTAISEIYPQAQDIVTMNKYREFSDEITYKIGKTEIWRHLPWPCHTFPLFKDGCKKIDKIK